MQEVLDELDNPLLSTIEQVTSAAKDLCRLFGGNQNFNASRSSGDESIAAMLYGCSLAVRVLSLGFQSYNRAHVGAFRPFFLDRTVHTVHLHGPYDHANSAPQASAFLQQLTCLDDMVQQPIVVFGSFPARRERTPYKERYDLLSTPEEFVDTWGPGQYVFADTESASRTLSAIMVGGGSVKLVLEDTQTLHWSKDRDFRHEFSTPYEADSKFRIGLGTGRLEC